MNAKLNIGKASFVVGLVALALLALTFTSAEAGAPRGAYYSPDGGRILWFMILSDTHIGTSGSADASNLAWAVTAAKAAVAPSFIVATGDLTDSTNGNFLGLPDGPHQEEWNEYKSLVDPYVTSADYFDLPGNHDAYSDRDFAYYLANSVQGRATGRKQHSWTRTPGFGAYHFLGINSADNTGAAFSIFSPYGDHAGLDAGELAYIQSELAANAGADLTFVFGHHPVTSTGTSSDTYLYYGHQQFISYLDAYAASMYGYGHTHAVSDVLFAGNSYTGPMSNGGIYYLNLASLGKDSPNTVTVVGIDGNGVSAVTQSIRTWPIVLITAPVSSTLGGAANPYAYTVPNGSTNPIRALVFDTVNVSQVTYRIDGAGTWFPMTKSASNPNLWEGIWNASGLTNGSHKIEVQAVGTTTRLDTINVTVAGTNSAPVAADDSYTTDQGMTLTVAAPGVLANDTDADGDALTASLVSGPAHGQLTLNANGSFGYVPAAGYSGPDSFVYAASDGKGGSATATVSITVRAAGDTVTVKTATFTRRTSTLAVTATSSAGGTAVLTVWNADQTVNIGTMTYKSKTKTYSFQIKGVANPGTVWVKSSKGGSASRTVTVK